MLDLRHVNKITKKHRCKIEGAHTFNNYLKDARYLFGFDLKSGYHHVDIHPSQHELLGFAHHDYTGKLRYFQFVVLPFGLCTAGFIFTQILRVLIKHWRTLGIPVVSFFDDGLSAATSFTSALKNSDIVLSNLLEAGYIPNITKSCWTPVQVLTWLGFIYDIIKGVISATPEKIEKCLMLRAQVESDRKLHIRTLASFTGTLLSLHIALGDIVYLKAKHLQILIASKKLSDDTQDWDCHVELNANCRAELVFWKNYLKDNCSMPIHINVASGAVSFSDASDSGTASVITPAPGQQSLKVVKQFRKSESLMSSTFRELMAVAHGLQEAKGVLANRSVRWLTDNQNVVSIIRKGSMKPHLLNLAVHIFELCKMWNILLVMSWIPRELNDKADYYSRVVDHDDWGVHKNWYKHIVRILGVPTIDRFADVDNRKTHRFNSRFFHMESEAVDAFTQEWRGEFNWLCSPIYLLVRTINYAQNLYSFSSLCKATLASIVIYYITYNIIIYHVYI